MFNKKTLVNALVSSKVSPGVVLVKKLYDISTKNVDNE